MRIGVRWACAARRWKALVEAVKTSPGTVRQCARTRHAVGDADEASGQRVKTAPIRRSTARESAFLHTAGASDPRNAAEFRTGTFFFSSIARSTPTATVEPARRPDGGLKTHLTEETFPTATVRLDLAARRSPSACAEKSLKKRIRRGPILAETGQARRRPRFGGTRRVHARWLGRSHRDPRARPNNLKSSEHRGSGSDALRHPPPRHRRRHA